MTRQRETKFKAVGGELVSFAIGRSLTIVKFPQNPFLMSEHDPAVPPSRKSGPKWIRVANGRLEQSYPLP